LYVQGGPKKEATISRIKNRQWATFFINFDYNMCTKIYYIKYCICVLPPKWPILCWVQH